MTRTIVFIASLAAAIVLPTSAAAHCSVQQGSFTVTCEQGVTVFRHQALSSIPQGISAADAGIEIEKLRQKTAQSKINAKARAQARNAKLRERELAIADYSARVQDRISRRRNIYYLPYGNGYNGYGFSGFQTVPSGNARTGNRNRAESNSTQTSVIQTTAAATNVSTRSTNIRRASFIGTSPSQNGGKRSAPKGSKKH